MTDIPAFAVRLAPMRLRFGAPAAAGVAGELAAMSLTRAVLLASPGHADEAQTFAAQIGPRVVATLAMAKCIGRLRLRRMR